MKINRDRLVFAAVGALIMVIFNVRYCHEVQTAERANFNGWVGTLGPRTIPSELQIEYRSGAATQIVDAKDEDTKAKALRLVQVLREAGVVGRLGGVNADRSVVVRAGPEREFSGSFSEEEARRSPPLQVFARLIAEFSPANTDKVASAPDSR